MDQYKYKKYGLIHTWMGWYVDSIELMYGCVNIGMNWSMCGWMNINLMNGLRYTDKMILIQMDQLMNKWMGSLTIQIHSKYWFN
jgi:hypothetical protein